MDDPHQSEYIPVYQNYQERTRKPSAPTDFNTDTITEQLLEQLRNTEDYKLLDPNEGFVDLINNLITVKSIKDLKTQRPPNIPFRLLDFEFQQEKISKIVRALADREVNNIPPGTQIVSDPNLPDFNRATITEGLLEQLKNTDDDKLLSSNPRFVYSIEQLIAFKHKHDLKVQHSTSPGLDIKFQQLKISKILKAIIGRWGVMKNTAQYFHISVNREGEPYIKPPQQDNHVNAYNTSKVKPVYDSYYYDAIPETIKRPMINGADAFIGDFHKRFDHVLDGPQRGYNYVSDKAQRGYNSVKFESPLSHAKPETFTRPIIDGVNTVSDGAQRGFNYVSDGAKRGFGSVANGAQRGFNYVSDGAKRGFGSVASTAKNMFGWKGGKRKRVRGTRKLRKPRVTIKRQRRRRSGSRKGKVGK
jgi:hypothetical protein